MLAAQGMCAIGPGPGRQAMESSKYLEFKCLLPITILRAGGFSLPQKLGLDFCCLVYHLWCGWLPHFLMDYLTLVQMHVTLDQTNLVVVLNISMFYPVAP